MKYYKNNNTVVIVRHGYDNDSVPIYKLAEIVESGVVKGNWLGNNIRIENSKNIEHTMWIPIHFRDTKSIDDKIKLLNREIKNLKIVKTKLKKYAEYRKS